MARSVVARDLHVVDLQDLPVDQTLSRAGNVVFCASENLDSREQLSHLGVALRVIIVMVSREDMRRRDLDSKYPKELHYLLRLSDIDQNAWLRFQVSRDVVAKVVSQHGDHVDFHIFFPDKINNDCLFR